VLQLKEKSYYVSICSLLTYTKQKQGKLNSMLQKM